MSDIQVQSESHPIAPCVATWKYDSAPRPAFYPVLFLLLSVFTVVLSSSCRAPGDGNVYLPFVDRVALPSLCQSRVELDLPCPGCGLTRCFVSMAHGQWTKAWHHHPAGILLFLFFVFQIPYRTIQLWQIHAGRRTWYFARVDWFVYLFLAVFLGHWIFKLFTV